MKPTLVLVGRPNVGKSTLFNRLTRTRDAIVADVPGLTRDRHYGAGRVGERAFLAVDTGGFEPRAEAGIYHEMAKQTRQAIAEGDVIVFVTDGREGIATQDREIGSVLRRASAKTVLAVNKAEGLDAASAAAEFYELGMGEPLAISAAHGEGVAALVERALSDFPVVQDDSAQHRHPRIAIVGRPNVGKSTLFNRLLGEERAVVFDQPGTTRDAIDVEFERAGKRYTLVDTAGIRRRGQTTEAVEKFSIIKTMQAVSDANVVLLVLDAALEISEQDARIAGFILESGRAIVLAINKWDSVDDAQRDWVKREIARKLTFLNFARLHYISALDDSGVDTLLDSADLAYAAAMTKLPTPKLTRVLQSAVAQQQPPKRGQFRAKLRYAHQGGSNPPIVVVHGNALASVPDSYRRYLENVFRREFDLYGTPLRIQFRQGRNPYAPSR